MEKIEGKNNSLRDKFSDEELVSFIESFYTSIKKKRRTNGEIQLKLGRRSINEIIASGETCFMGSCVDSSLAFIQKLREEGVDVSKVSLGCELLKVTDNGFYTVHFFVQDSSSAPSRVIDFVRAGEISIYDGEYKNPKVGKGVEHLQNFFLNANEISGDDSLITIASKMQLPVNEEYFSGYIKKIQMDNTDETYERFMKYESGLRVSINNKMALNKSVEEQKQETEKALFDELGVDKEHQELYSLMNELWGIIGHLFGYPYGVIVGMERALRSETDPELEKKSKQDFLLGTHQDLIEKYGVNDAIEVTYITLKSGAEIELTNTIRGQVGTRNSLESIMNYANRVLQYEDPEKYNKFYELWFELQKFGKTGKTVLREETQVVGNTESKLVEDGKFHYKHEGD